MKGDTGGMKEQKGIMEGVFKWEGQIEVEVGITSPMHLKSYKNLFYKLPYMCVYLYIYQT